MRSHLHSRSDSKYILAMDSLASAAEHRGLAFGNLKLLKINALLRAAFAGKLQLFVERFGCCRQLAGMHIAQKAGYLADQPSQASHLRSGKLCDAHSLIPLYLCSLSCNSCALHYNSMPCWHAA